MLKINQINKNKPRKLKDKLKSNKSNLCHSRNLVIRLVHRTVGKSH